MSDFEQYQESYTNFLSHNQRTSQNLRMSANVDYEDSPPAKMANIGKYPVVQDNGHRRIGPPMEWVGEAPQRGCEVFIGKIPRDCVENELIPVFESIGPIYEFRLMVDFNGINRGYGFCVYQNKEHSNKAVEKLNNYEIRPGKAIGVCFSVDNCRLFVGGIPKNKTKEEILSEMQRVTNGVVDVIAYPSIANKNKNRGFAFVEYESHKAAAVARRKLIPGRIPLWGQQIAVDWAEPEREVQETIMSTVKILYARNLMLSTTEETLREKFLASSEGPFNCIERVKKMKDYAFIHFTDRIYAEKAKNALNNTDIDGCIIEVTWAKPADKSQFKQGKSQPINNEFSITDIPGSTQIYYDPNTGLSYLGPAIGSLSNSINMLGDNYLRNKVTRRNAAGSRNIGTMKEKRQSIEYLEELATTYNWGIPQYSTSVSEMDRGGSKTQLFSAQVFLPNLNVKQATQVLHSSSEEAKSAAAELFIKSVSQPPNPFNGIDIRQQIAALQTLNQMQLAAIFNPNAGALNQSQPPLDLSTAAGASLYYLQPGLANTALLHPQSILSPPHSTQLNLAAFNSLYSDGSNNMTSLINSPPRDGNSLGNLFSASNGLNILTSSNAIPLLSMNIDTNSGDIIDNPALRNYMLASQQGYLYNTQQSNNDPSTLLMNQQVPGQ